jgi:hypothetical protein
VEAIFLEQYEAQWLLLALFAAAPAAAGTVLLYHYGHPLTPVGIVLQISLVYFGWACVRCGLISVASFVMEKTVTPRVKSWGATTLGGRIGIYKEQLTGGAVAMVLYLVFLFGGLGLLSTLVGNRVMDNDDPLTAFLKVHDVELLAIGVTVVTSIVLLRLRKRMSAGSSEMLTRLRLAGDLYFEDYIRRAVLEEEVTGK